MPSISLINATELKKLLDTKAESVSLIDTRGEEIHAEGRIPGSVHIAWEEWCEKPPAGLSDELNQPGYWGLLTEMDDKKVGQRLTDLGFNNDKTLVIYADGKKSKGREGRISWMLLYFGAKDVRILNGGYRGWLEIGGATETGAEKAPAKSAQPFTVQREENRRVLLAALKDMMASEPFPLLIDTRSKAEFIGDSYPYMPRTGTLPHAHLIPYADVFKDDGTFISGEEFKSLLPTDQPARKATIAFCEVGVRACTIALLHEIYTGKIIPVYDGSIMEWGADPNLPMSRQLKSK